MLLKTLIFLIGSWAIRIRSWVLVVSFDFGLVAFWAFIILFRYTNNSFDRGFNYVMWAMG